MKIPKKHKVVLTFKHKECWYKVSCPENDTSVYSLYKQLSEDDFEFLGTANNPPKLENRVYAGKYS